MPNSANPRPNIIFILSDDQGYWASGAYGNREVRTPGIDALSESGVTFDRMYCVSPVCSPARASILTGVIPSAHGVYDWIRHGNTHLEEGGTQPISYLDGLTSSVSLLASAGYRCGCFGKWHLGNVHLPQQGFTDWFVYPHGAGTYNDSHFVDRDGVATVHPGYVSDVITDHALEFLESASAADQPFYLSLHYTAPHSPWDREEHPAEIYDRYFADCPFESVPNLSTNALQINSAPVPRTARERRAILSGYYAAIERMDDNIRRVEQALRDHGQRENTLIVFTSDNGMNMGHHGLYGKGNATFPQNMFETSVRVPAVFSHPGTLPQGVRSDALVSHYDIFPTILEYTGHSVPDTTRRPGISLLPVLREPGSDRPDDADRGVVVFSEYGPVHMILTSRWKYVHRYPYGPHELYDLAEDPEESHNLFGLSEFKAIAEELRHALSEWFALYADPLYDGRTLPVTGRGQMDTVKPGAACESAFADDWRYLTRDGER
ncbi:MAG: DUF4976 domain-containing protein [Spirochaetaceae bacterium]|nr:MAG: DUF4976 domain-containing protein [Spirochaetaceae bacterium]